MLQIHKWRGLGYRLTFKFLAIFIPSRDIQYNAYWSVVFLKTKDITKYQRMPCLLLNQRAYLSTVVVMNTSQPNKVFTTSLPSLSSQAWPRYDNPKQQLNFQYIQWNGNEGFVGTLALIWLWLPHVVSFDILARVKYIYSDEHGFTVSSYPPASRCLCLFARRGSLKTTEQN